MIAVSGTGPWDAGPGPSRRSARRTSYETSREYDSVRARARYENQAAAAGKPPPRAVRRRPPPYTGASR